MAKAIDFSGSVDQTKFHACNAANIINMSFINIVVEQLASKCVPFQKFILDRLCTMRRFMACFRVVSQCGIPRLVHGRPILVDLNKLHFDHPRPGSTNIKVSGEALP